MCIRDTDNDQRIAIAQSCRGLWCPGHTADIASKKGRYFYESKHSYIL
jgi:hypothetical protein